MLLLCLYTSADIYVDEIGSTGRDKNQSRYSVRYDRFQSKLVNGMLKASNDNVNYSVGLKIAA